MTGGCSIDLFEEPLWQMTLGERAAIHGLLSALKPSLAIEIGTAEGACLRWIAQHAVEVHSFDFAEPSIRGLGDQVYLHTGDSHVLLPQVLERFVAEDRNVDFVLVDGDHSPEGVRRDLEMLLGSPAIVDAVIVTHDVGNERVRAGLDAVAYGAYPKVGYVDLDFVPGHLGQDRFAGELWGGLGLVVVSADRPVYGSGPPVQTDHHHGGDLLAIARDVLCGRPPDAGRAFHDARARHLSDAYKQIDELEQQIAAYDGAQQQRVAELTAEVVRHRALAEHHRSLVSDLMTSASWRVSAPLRVAKRAATVLLRR